MSVIFRKTDRGRAEVGDDALGLDQLQRRVLILINGRNDNSALSRMSLAQDVDEIIEFLLEKKLIEAQSSDREANDYTDTITDIDEVTEPMEQASAAVNS